MAEEAKKKGEKEVRQKIISFVDKNTPSYRALECFINGQDRMCRGVKRTGFKPKEGFCENDCCLIFSIVPIRAMVNRYFHIELSGAIKCAITLLRPWQYIVVSGIFDEKTELMPNYIISFDGVKVEVQSQEKFDFEKFKKNADELFRKRERTGMDPQVQELLSVVRAAEKEHNKRKATEKISASA